MTTKYVAFDTPNAGVRATTLPQMQESQSTRTERTSSVEFCSPLLLYSEGLGVGEVGIVAKRIPPHGSSCSEIGSVRQFDRAQ